MLVLVTLLGERRTRRVCIFALINHTYSNSVGHRSPLTFPTDTMDSTMMDKLRQRCATEKWLAKPGQVKFSRFLTF